MSCVSLITADTDQAFEACSSSAVLTAWKRISQTYESRFLSNSILVRQGRREFVETWEVSIVWSRVPVVHDTCSGQDVIQLHVRYLGNVGIRGVANSGHSYWWSHEFCGRGCRSGRVNTWVVWAAWEASLVRFLSVGVQSAVASRGEGMWMMC